MILNKVKDYISKTENIAYLIILIIAIGFGIHRYGFQAIWKTILLLGTSLAISSTFYKAKNLLGKKGTLTLRQLQGKAMASIIVSGVMITLSLIFLEYNHLMLMFSWAAVWIIITGLIQWLN